MRLRAFTGADLAAVRRLLTDPDVRAHLGGPLAADEVEAVLARPPGQHWGVFAVERLAGGAVLGTVDLKDDRGEPEVGYTFLPEHWGHGYAKEAVVAVLTWLATQPGREDVTSVIAVTQVANARSRHLLAALGGVEESRFEEWGDEQVQVRLPLTRPPGSEG